MRGDLLAVLRRDFSRTVSEGMTSFLFSPGLCLCEKRGHVATTLRPGQRVAYLLKKAGQLNH